MTPNSISTRHQLPLQAKGHNNPTNWSTKLLAPVHYTQQILAPRVCIVIFNDMNK